MAAQKGGKATAVAFLLTCPHCHEAVRCPSTGSFMIGGDSLHSWARTLRVEVDAISGVPCSECGKHFRLPAVIRSLA